MGERYVPLSTWRFGLFMTELRIGHAGQQYPERRNIIDLVPEAKYLLCRDWFSFRSRLDRYCGQARSSADACFNRQFQFQDFGLNRVDCIHLFNSVNYSSKPWVLTFETLVPRFKTVLANRVANPSLVMGDPQVKNALDAMAGPNCLALLPISKSAEQIQDGFLALFPGYSPSLAAKTRVLAPPQRLIVNEPGNIQYPCEGSRSMRFMMVGHHFFRKGGREVLDVLAQARRELSVDIRLCIVSNITDDGYATDISSDDYLTVRQFIAANTEWIEHYPFLEPKEVENQMQKCDVGLLPSYAETYGYSVLEFQAAGRPVITTNVRAFPETNNNDCGWTIAVPKREVGGEAFFRTSDEKLSLSVAIKSGLQAAVTEIMEQPSLVRTKGLKAWERIRDMHSPVAAGTLLRKIYSSALR